MPKITLDARDAAEVDRRQRRAAELQQTIMFLQQSFTLAQESYNTYVEMLGLKYKFPPNDPSTKRDGVIVEWEEKGK